MSRSAGNLCSTLRFNVTCALAATSASTWSVRSSASKDVCVSSACAVPGIRSMSSSSSARTMSRLTETVPWNRGDRSELSFCVVTRHHLLDTRAQLASRYLILICTTASDCNIRVPRSQRPHTAECVRLYGDTKSRICLPLPMRSVPAHITARAARRQRRSRNAVRGRLLPPWPDPGRVDEVTNPDLVVRRYREPVPVPGRRLGTWQATLPRWGVPGPRG